MDIFRHLKNFNVLQLFYLVKLGVIYFICYNK
jgi:hypothetical protein